MQIKPNFFGSKEFRLFFTVWIIYIFYLQMFGSSCMANSQSALASSIVNELRFEVDTYSKVSCDLALYNGHYYSGMSPGISLISVPLYVLSKPVFYILPQETVDLLFGKLEEYGNKIPADLLGQKKILSNYFFGLSKRQILEYVLISGFVLPVFTTALISAISAVLLYTLLKRFTSNNRLRILIAFFYSFGTIMFPKSTEFFQRPIAIAIAFTAFIILFRIRHNELKPKGTTLFVAGMLAGLSALFDYFHLIVAGLLFFYLLFFSLGKKKPLLLLKFAIGASIPVLLLLTYQYIVFHNLFGIPYYYRTYLQSEGSVAEAYSRYIPSRNIPFSMVVFHILELFLYSPILLLALYGIYKALLKKDKYYYDAIAVTVFVALTLSFIFGVLIFYHSGIGPSIKRYMSPIIPYLMVFLPYALNSALLPKKNIIKMLFIFFGIVSIFTNWVSAQFGGHWALTHFDVKNIQFPIIAEFLKSGPQSSFLNAVAGTFNIAPLVLNLAGLVLLILLVFIIWKPSKDKV